MFIHLLKKDILITKKYIILVLVIGFAIPLFILWRVPMYSESLGFALSVIFSEFMFCQNLSMKENHYSKVAALIATTPYKRSEMVISKYILFVLIFLYCTLTYGIDVLLFPSMGKFRISYVLAVFAITSIAYSIYLPVQYWIGYEKTKFFFIIVLLAASFGLPALISRGSDNILDLLKNFFFFFLGLVLGITFIIVSLSMMISVKIYSKKDLA